MRHSGGNKNDFVMKIFKLAIQPNMRHVGYTHQNLMLIFDPLALPIIDTNLGSIYFS